MLNKDIQVKLPPRDSLEELKNETPRHKRVVSCHLRAEAIRILEEPAELVVDIPLDRQEMLIQARILLARPRQKNDFRDGEVIAEFAEERAACVTVEDIHECGFDIHGRGLVIVLDLRVREIVIDLAFLVVRHPGVGLEERKAASGKAPKNGKERGGSDCVNGVGTF